MSGDVIAKVQEVLFDDEAFMNRLEAWCAERSEAFDLDDDGEHKLEWTELHEQFCLLFERRITTFLEENGHSIEEFWQTLTKAADGDPSLFNESFLLEALRATVDYEQFVVTMRGLKRSNQGK